MAMHISIAICSNTPAEFSLVKCKCSVFSCSDYGSDLLQEVDQIRVDTKHAHQENKACLHLIFGPVNCSQYFKHCKINHFNINCFS